MTQPSYADQVNAKYQNSADHFVDLKQRFNDTMSLYNPTTQATIRGSLKRAIAEFQKRHGNVRSFKDPRFRLCQAQVAKLSNILIDTTMQRQLDISWVIRIIENFRAWQAMPVQVYRAGPGAALLWDGQLAHLGGDLYASWDGQHTAMAFYIIAVMIMGLDPAEVEIPVVIYEVNTKAEIRQAFIEGNTEVGKKLLDKIDVFQQMIYGVRVDGATDPVWIEVEQKQQYLESTGLFVTAQKFKDTDQIGAISRPEDVMDRKTSPELIRQFTVYAQHVLDMQPRAINTKEFPIIVGFLKMAASGNATGQAGGKIIYTDDEIRSLAQLCLDLFSADFDADGPFWAQLEQAYAVWWNTHYASVDVSMRPAQPRMNKDWTQGGTFFWHQLRKSWRDEAGQPMRMPQLNIQTPFIPDPEDLF